MLNFYDRVVESTLIVGLGNVSLNGTSIGYKKFSDVLSVGQKTCYCIEAISFAGMPTGEWEIGDGTLLSPILLSRDNIYTSSTGNKIDFKVGNKRIFITFPSHYISSIKNDCTYIHDQAMASTIWNVSHNLNKYPSVSVVDSGGNWGIGDITYTDINNLIISFSFPFGGKAYCN